MRSEPNAQNGASQRVIAASAPGKVILSGEHSVVYNRRAIATTLSLRLTVRLERCQTNTIALISQVSLIFQKFKIKTFVENSIIQHFRPIRPQDISPKL